jgi:DNA mismatch endonuclease (patch repair protein)
MRNAARRDTAPELALRRRLHALGFRYRVDAPLPGAPRRRADLLFRRERVAVFVDGCFWHRCPVHSVAPKANAEWWQTKLESNQQRDRETDDLLAAQGWLSVRCWEHEAADEAADRIAQALRARR